MCCAKHSPRMVRVELKFRQRLIEQIRRLVRNFPIEVMQGQTDLGTPTIPDRLNIHLRSKQVRCVHLFLEHKHSQREKGSLGFRNMNISSIQCCRTGQTRLNEFSRRDLER